MSEEYFVDSDKEYIKPEDFISDDDGNSIILGTDKKLLVRTSKGSGNGGSVSLTVPNVKSGDEIIINKEIDPDYTSAGALTVWEYTEENTKDIKEDIVNYNIENKDNFITTEFVEFTETGVKVKTEYSQPMEYKGTMEDMYLYSCKINLDNFKEFKVI